MTSVLPVIRQLARDIANPTGWMSDLPCQYQSRIIYGAHFSSAWDI